jgi:iron complex outermembrane recepter protein
MKKILLLLFFLGTLSELFAQVELTGQVFDAETNDPLIGASIMVKNQAKGTITDVNGKFNLKVDKLPVILIIGYVGYANQEIEFKTVAFKKISLGEDSKALTEAVVKKIRVSEKQKESALTVESIGLKAIKETPSATFYESLGNLKGVDITSASLGFRVINTRGFNSTSPVRSLQLIDGVDNQSPGLNFSLGNFLGSSDLDVKQVDVIAGASSAFYGPNAFNGVIFMESKDPFTFQGFSMQIKVGERNLKEIAFRQAEAFKNKKGKEVFAYKVSFSSFSALDWKATNYKATSDSKNDETNPGGFDAINIYGDEVLEPNNDYTHPSEQYENPGLGVFYRKGYKEIDLVDYNTNNYKFNTAFHYKVTDKNELIYAFNVGGGTTVYQGDNRYSLKNIRFWQNRIEYRQKDKFFIRAYSTQEDAGDSYDVVSTAMMMNQSSFNNSGWNTAYKVNWKLGYKRQVEKLPGFPTYAGGKSIYEWETQDLEPFLAKFQDTLSIWHARNTLATDKSEGGGKTPRYDEGTPAFDSLFNLITSLKFNQGGTRFFDQSALYHLHGEYKFKPKWAEIVLGGNGRMYRPNTDGTIFIDTAGKKITNHEFGVYTGAEKYIMNKRLKFNFTTRLDKNQNFNFLVSPALSTIFNLSKEHVFRLSFSSAIRNPTLADQYLYYNVGRALLLGNLNGYDSLITISSFTDYRNTLDVGQLKYFNVDPIRPEKVKTFEIGYKGFLMDNSIFVDAGYYYSIYDNFIGYKIGLDAEFDPATRFPIGGINVYRLAANADSRVTTQGFSVAFSYFHKKMAYTANYSWNKLNKKGADDPIIPAFNTPENKFNLGMNGRELKVPFTNFKRLGFGLNYKWVQGFIFEGSPQFTGKVPSYDMVDGQINYSFPKANCTIKLGGSNLFGFQPLFKKGVENRLQTMFDNKNFQVYGGPYIGRLAYISVLFELSGNKNNPEE